MIEIKTSTGVILDLLPNTAITLELTNPMFEEQGSHSMGFDLPASAKNLRELGFPNRVDSLNATKSLSVEVSFDGLLIMRPTLTVKKWDGKIRGWFAENEGDFYQAVKDKMLQDFEYETQEYMQNDYFDYLMEQLPLSYPDSNFINYPVLNQEFYKDTDYYDISGSETYYYNAYQNKYVTLFDGGTPYLGIDVANNTLLTCFVYLSYVLDIIFNQSNFALDENVFYQNEELRTLTIFNVNAVKRKWAHAASTQFFHDLKNHLPELTVVDMLGHLHNKFNTVLFTRNLNRSARLLFKQDIILSGVYKDLTDIASPVKSIEYIVDTDGAFLKFDPDTNDEHFTELYADIYLYPDLIEDPVADYATLTAITTDRIGTIRLVVDKNWYYQFVHNSSTSLNEWQYYSRNTQFYKLGNGGYEVDSDISHLISVATFTTPEPGGTRQWTMPKARQKGNDPDFAPEMIDREFKFRLMFYRGEVGIDNFSLSYPLGSEDIIDGDGNSISGANISLHNDGTAGLYENFWKKYLHWYTNERKLCKVNLKVNSPFLQALDFSKKYRIDEQNYLIKKLSVQITNNRIMPAEAELYTV